MAVPATKKRKVFASKTGITLFILICFTSIFGKFAFSQADIPLYEISRPQGQTEAVLVLFGGYYEFAPSIKQEFNIEEKALERNIAVIFMNYNQKLWLSTQDLVDLNNDISVIFKKEGLPAQNIFIGGFSSGGNVAMMFSNYLMEEPLSNIKLKGTFIIDSPIDLLELYRGAQKNLERNFSQMSVEESRWIITQLKNAFDDPDKSIALYEKHSVFTLETQNLSNLAALQESKIRLYTEPDISWWKTNRMADYEQMNAYHIKRMHEALQSNGFDKVEYIPTENRGYRTNGDRHPHSWSIVNQDELIDWILE